MSWNIFPTKIFTEMNQILRLSFKRKNTQGSAPQISESLIVIFSQCTYFPPFLIRSHVFTRKIGFKIDEKLLVKTIRFLYCSEGFDSELYQRDIVIVNLVIKMADKIFLCTVFKTK